MASLHGTLPHPAHTPLPDIDALFTSPVLTLEMARKNHLQKGGESGPDRRGNADDAV